MCSNLTENEKVQIDNSDTDLAMLAANTFDYILCQVQNSSLNFQLQLSPFTAYISLKKSLVKDKHGKPSLPRLSSQVSSIDNVNNKKLELDLLELQQKYDTLMRDYNSACDTIKNLNEAAIVKKESLVCEMKDEDQKIKDMENLIRDREATISILQCNNKTAQEVANKLNKELNDSKAEFVQRNN